MLLHEVTGPEGSSRRRVLPKTRRRSDPDGAAVSVVAVKLCALHWFGFFCTVLRLFCCPKGDKPPYRSFSRVSVIRLEPGLWLVSLPIRHTIEGQERDGRGSFLSDSGAGYPGSATSSAS